MAGLKDVYCGARFDVHCVTSGNFEDFLDKLEKRDAKEAKKVFALIERCADHGPPKNEEKCRSIGDGMWELKTTRIRIAFFYQMPKRIILTHAFLKQKKKSQDGDIGKAKTLRNNFLAALEANKNDK